MLKEALIDKDTDSHKIIYNMIYVCSFCRRWRQYLIDNGLGATHFLTANVWTCIELNTIFTACLANTGHQRLISIFNSQPCEQFFRSLTPSLVTINFTTKEAFLKVQHVVAVVLVTNELKDDENITFVEKLANNAIPDSAKFVPEFVDDIDLIV